MSLKQKSTAGFTWSFIEIVFKQGITFVIGIILARLLTPREFGLVGMTMIFINFSMVFVNGGFGQALVRKQNCTQKDFSTVFIFNLIASILLYILLFLLAPAIANFFDEPKLQLIVKVISFGLVIKSFSMIQSVKLIKNIDFKTQTKVTVIASIGSGIAAIFMAYSGYGVWSLVVKFLLNYFLITVSLWLLNNWKPSVQFSKTSFIELFSFGSKLLGSNLINKAYENAYLFVIGKYFSASNLGYYTRADQFKNLFSKNLTSVIQRVSYPALASIQDENTRLKRYYQILIKSSMLVSSFIGIGMIVMAEPLIVSLIGEKWLPSVKFLQLLSIAGMLFPIQEFNKNILKVKGRSDLILKLEIGLKIGAVPVIIIGVFLGMTELILGLILIAIVSYLTISYYAGKAIGYFIVKQLKDFVYIFIVAIVSGVVTYSTNFIFKADYSHITVLLIQMIVYTFVFIIMNEFLRFQEYILLKGLAKEKINSVFRGK